MHEFYPLLCVGGIIGVISIVFLIAYLSIKDKREAIGFETKNSFQSYVED